LLFVSLWFAFSIAGAQTGKITDGGLPTYHPSSTRDTAVEVKVAGGEEVSGIDIRRRGDRGRVISGVVRGGGETETTATVSVTLFDTRAKTSAGSSFIQPGGARGFAFNGVPDGEYILTARTTNAESNWASAPRRVTLSGKDATGLELKLLPLGSISGRIVVESLPEPCGEKSQVQMESFNVTANRDDARKDDFAFLPGRFFSSQRANEKGEFTIDNVDPGNYRIGTRVLGENYYIKAITSAPTAPARRGAPPVNDISRNGLALKQGERLSGVTITIAEGAASLQGKVVAEKEGDRLPASPGGLRALLIPAEPNTVDNVLRYAEALIRNDGEFAFNNITPGKYWLITRVIPGADPNDRPPAPVAWDANERAKLRLEAQAAKYEIEIQPCGRVKDFVLRFVR